MINIKHTNPINIGALVLIGLFICFRFIYLDQDAGLWSTMAICQEDEAYYTVSAIEQVTNTPQIIDGASNTLNKFWLNGSSIPTYIGLKTLGLNYWGLRIGPVIISLLIILLIINSLPKISRYNKFIITLLLLSDFYFMVISRYQTPIIYSLFIIVLTTYIYFKKQGRFWLIVIGGLTISSVLFIYVYNLFFFAAISSVILIESVRERESKTILYYIIGVVLGTLLFTGLMYCSGQSWSNYITTLTGHGGGTVDFFHLNFSLLFSLIKSGVSSIFLTNFYRFNPIHLFLFIFSLTYISLNFKSFQFNKFLLLALLALFFLIFQSTFVISYPQRKLFVFFLFSILIIYTVLSNFHNILNTKWKTRVSISSALIGSIYFLRINHSMTYWSLNSEEFFTPKYITTIGLFISTIAILTLIISHFRNKFFTKTLLIFTIVLNTFYSSYFFIYDASFNYRDGLKKFKKFTNNEIIGEGFSHAYVFYANCVPAQNCYLDRRHLGVERYNALSDSLYVNNIAKYKIFKTHKYQYSQFTDSIAQLNKHLIIDSFEHREYVTSLVEYKHTLIENNEIEKQRPLHP